MSIKKKPRRFLALMLDYTGLPRAWGAADTRDGAEAIAREQLERYCEKKQGLGEPDLADPRRFSLHVEMVRT